MRWGRNKSEANIEIGHTARGASAALIAGTILCAVFFSVAVHSDHTIPSYPEEMAAEAVQTFMAEHATLADALGIDEYFPADAVPAGAFEDKSEAEYRKFVDRNWSFGAYLRDAFRVLLGGNTP